MGEQLNSVNILIGRLRSIWLQPEMEVKATIW
jgi:hypothetical protein